MSRHNLHSPWENQGRGSEQCRQATVDALLFPLRWARDELRTWGTKEKLAAVYCVTAVAVVLFWRWTR